MWRLAVGTHKNWTMRRLDQIIAEVGSANVLARREGGGNG
jgi:hypothetical protein